MKILLISESELSGCTGSSYEAKLFSATHKFVQGRVLGPATRLQVFPRATVTAVGLMSNLSFESSQPRGGEP